MAAPLSPSARGDPCSSKNKAQGWLRRARPASVFFGPRSPTQLPQLEGSPPERAQEQKRAEDQVDDPHEEVRAARHRIEPALRLPLLVLRLRPERDVDAERAEEHDPAGDEEDDPGGKVHV